jgi:hypothetical protein
MVARSGVVWMDEWMDGYVVQETQPNNKNVVHERTRRDAGSEEHHQPHAPHFSRIVTESLVVHEKG